MLIGLSGKKFCYAMVNDSIFDSHVWKKFGSKERIHLMCSAGSLMEVSEHLNSAENFILIT
jgi:hypothetical protein